MPQNIPNQQLARKLLEVIPPLMHWIRAEVRLAAREKLTVAQFRILVHLERGLDRVGQLAQHLDVSQPAMSKMVDGLVERGLVKRQNHAGDRRQIALSVSAKGQTLLARVRSAAQERLGLRLSDLDPLEREHLSDALARIETLVKATRKGKT